MVVVEGAGLVSEGGIEGDALVDIGITIPDPIAPALEVGDRTRIGGVTGAVRERVGGVEHGDTVDEVADGAPVGEGLGGGDGGSARDTIEHVGVTGVVGEIVGFVLVEIPWAHGVESKAGATDVDPVVRVGDLVDAGVGGGGLHALAAAPSGHGIAGELGGGGLVEAGISPAGTDEPAGVARVVGRLRESRGDGQRRTEEREDNARSRMHGPQLRGDWLSLCVQGAKNC